MQRAMLGRRAFVALGASLPAAVMAQMAQAADLESLADHQAMGKDRPSYIESVITYHAPINDDKIFELIRAIDLVLDRGAQTIHLIIESSGGRLNSAAFAFYYLRGLRANLTTYNYTFVESSANLLFLAGEKRYATSTARFLFHPVTIGFNTSDANAGDFQGQIDALAQSTRIYNDIVRLRTKITDAEIESFSKATVNYVGDQAIRAGIISGLNTFTPLNKDQARIIVR